MKCEDWGLIDYKEALNKQLSLLQKIKDNHEEESLIFCTHPPVITLGRGSKNEDVSPSWKGPLYKVSRGGKATYHGPSQLMVYSLIDIGQKNRKFLKSKDLMSYLRLLENIFVESLNHFGISSSNSSLKNTSKISYQNSQNPQSTQRPQRSQRPQRPQSFTGVWIGSQKLVSIGVAFKHWISYHGASMNLEKDESAFQDIHPCGFSPKIMTSAEEVLNKKMSKNHFKDVFKEIFFQKFS